MPHTKIVATLGPASDPAPVFRRLVEEGVDVFRLNASHGTLEEHDARIAAVREAAAAREGAGAAILFDLQGPKIRLGEFIGSGCMLRAGDEFTITVEHVMGNCARASTTYAGFAQDVHPGDRVLVADGAVALQVLASNGTDVRTRVIAGGHVSDHKGINLPGVSVNLPSLTEKDLRDLDFALERGVSMIALSFVRSAGDVLALRERMGTHPAAVVAKIEKPQACENIEAILDAADGVMVARGDLGVEMELEKVPQIQKAILRSARRKAKFTITATQMLESMVEHPTPTRAEVSDVANAIYDGTDAVMLSAETSVGQYPAEAVNFMNRIAAETEQAAKAQGFRDLPADGAVSTADIVADAAWRAASEANVAAIVVFTTSGSSARLVSRYRPPVTIYAITPNELAARQLMVNYAVEPVLAPAVASTDEMLRQMDRMMVERGYLRRGDLVVFVAGQPAGRPGTTNLMKLHRIGDG